MTDDGDLREAELRRRVAELEHELVAIRGSLSWRVTTPLRAAKRLAKGRRRLPTGYTTAFLNGGLGNQLFQYAAGMQVASQTGTHLRVDRAALGHSGAREYQLDEFVKPEATVARPRFNFQSVVDEEAFGHYAFDRYRVPVVRERNNGRTDELTSIEGDSVLVGYWQSEDYFPDVADEVKRVYRRRLRDVEDSAVAREIKAARVSVAMHVRRGDYVSDPRIVEILGFLGPDYYRDAAALVESELGTVDWFVFSDDPDWCSANLDLGGNVTIVSGGTSNVEDLGLIALCDHAVISNSSFSWWGAWLGETPDSLVVAPDRWTLTPDVFETPGRVPARWRRIATRQGVQAVT